MRANLLQSRLAALLPVLEQAAVRLRDPADVDILHALRVALRKLRIVLKPFCDDAAVAGLLDSAGVVARLAGAPRDEEVLLTELCRQGLPAVAARRRSALVKARCALADSPGLQAVQVQWPVAMRALAAYEAPRKTRRTSIHRARKAVREWLSGACGDLHVLRLRIKRLRYRLQTDPAAPAHLLAQLRQIQSVLGEWHDRELWLQQAQADAELQVCVPCWQREQALLVRQLAPLLEGLRHSLA